MWAAASSCPICTGLWGAGVGAWTLGSEQRSRVQQEPRAEAAPPGGGRGGIGSLPE